MSIRLDRFQLSVVDSPQNASLCVAACPGSGKSTTLAWGADGGGGAAGGNKENTAAAGAAAPAKRSRFLFGLQTTVGASGATFLVPASPPSLATGS